MLNKKDQQAIKKTIKDFFAKLDREGKLEEVAIEENVVSFELQTKTPEIFIGKQGRILLAIQHLLGKILRKQTEENLFVDFDINQYKKKKTDYLRGLAQNLADQVALEKQERTLSPMPSYERRIVHVALNERKDVKTESVGEEPERRVVIRPAE